LGYIEYLNKIEKSTPVNVYWLFGKEKKLIDQLVEKLIPKISFQEKNILFGGEMDVDSLVRSLFEADLFSSDKLNIIRDCNEIKWTKEAEKSFARWLQNPTAGNYLIFIGNGKKDFPAAIKKPMEKIAEIFELKPLYENETRQYLQNLAKLENKKISSASINSIIELCGTDLQEIHSQWDKLILFLGDKEEVDANSVEEVIGLTSHFNVFQLIDNMMIGNYKKALKIIKSLLETGTHPLQPLALIIRHFSQLEQLLLAGNDYTRIQELKKALKIWDFQFSKMQNQMQRLSLSRVEEIISELSNIDVELKTRSVSAAHTNVVFEKGILKIFTLLKKA